MPDDAAPLDPYKPPTDQGYTPPPTTTPGGLKAICIIAVVLGGLGLVGALMGVAGAIFGKQIQSLFTPPANAQGNEMMELQREMTQQINEVTNSYAAFSLIASLGHLVVAALLLIGGIKALGLSLSGRKLLLIGCLAAVILELGRAALGVMVQLESAAIMSEFTDRMAEAAGNEAGAGVFGAIMSGSVYVGMMIGMVFVGAKIVFYVISARYLSKPNITALFK